MSDRAELLLGGWIAGTLTPGERRELMAAAMANQALFDALADEEGLRELLADPAVRRELSALLAEQAPASDPVKASWWDWFRFRNPAPLAAAGAAALAVVGFLALRPGLEQRASEPAAKTSAPAIAAPASAPGPVMDKAVDVKQEVRTAAPPLRRENAARPVAVMAPPTPLPPPPSAAGAGNAVETAASGPLLEAERASAPPPPAPAASAPIEAVSVGESKKAKMADSLSRAESDSVAATADFLQTAAPIAYRLERQQLEGGSWTPVSNATAFAAGDRARLAITATQAGTVQIRAGAEQLSVRAPAGGVIYYPPSGAMAAERGERTVAVSFSPLGPRARPETQADAPTAARNRRSQQSAAGPGQFTISVRIVYR